MFYAGWAHGLGCFFTFKIFADLRKLTIFANE